KKKDAINFEVEIASNGVDLFFKENYPSMKLNQEQGRNVIRGFYNRGEEPFIINYLLGFGDKINMVQPDSLKEMLLNELKSLQNHLQKLS
ncbi:TPA: WYL domain-containing protein, partial [Listeria monocytogenes]|nr:WYL domain-containing protein [Listeria monocytogenes]